MTSYEISVNKYRDYYNFEDAELVVDNFLRNVCSRFKPKGQVLLKSVQENLRPIVNTRY